MEIKNMVSDLTEEQRNIVLTRAGDLPARGYEGKTLGEFIDGEMMENSTLTELADEMSVWRLKWPFRKLLVTVEVAITRGYEIAVLDDKTLDAFANGDIEQINELDPKFNLAEAYEETAAGYIEGDQANYDYAVMDDTGRTILDFD